jgi:hypothetical protein
MEMDSEEFPAEFLLDLEAPSYEVAPLAEEKINKETKEKQKDYSYREVTFAVYPKIIQELLLTLYQTEKNFYLGPQNSTEQQLEDLVLYLNDELGNPEVVEVFFLLFQDQPKKDEDGMWWLVTRLDEHIRTTLKQIR